jgi:CBS domain containing-hemolysin-like protein
MALVAMNAFFVVAEFALVSVRRSRVDEMIAQGNATARVVRHAISDPDRFIAATQLGITLASLGLGWIGEPAFAELLAPLLAMLPTPWSEALIHSISVAMAFTIITFLHVVLGELAPKSIALQQPERASLFVARPIMLTENLFRPAIWLLNGAGNGLLKLLGLRSSEGHQLVHSVEELRILMRESQEGGAIEADQEEMLQKVFEFGERQVREVMIPRPAVQGIEASATLGDLLATFAGSLHARYPVYENNLDNITGIVAVKDILLAMANGTLTLETGVASLVRPPLFVPETTDVADLFARLRRSHMQMAIVFDEYGGTAGIVTLEELVEEIVGQVSDELIQGEGPVVHVNETTAEVDALLRVDEVNEHLGLHLPEHEAYETLAGLILYRLQHIPVEGETLRYQDLEITVTQMKGPKIEKVQVRQKVEG